MRYWKLFDIKLVVFDTTVVLDISDSLLSLAADYFTANSIVIRVD